MNMMDFCVEPLTEENWLISNCISTFHVNTISQCRPMQHYARSHATQLPTHGIAGLQLQLATTAQPTRNR